MSELTPIVEKLQKIHNNMDDITTTFINSLRVIGEENRRSAREKAKRQAE